MGTEAEDDSADTGALRIAAEDQPKPVWRSAPRYMSHVELPAYRHVPGVTPHPVRDKRGHSHGLLIAKPSSVTDSNWMQHRGYLRGIDLYHQGYFWEAHEEWEGPWSKAEPDSVEANYLQALILNSAAQLKIHAGNAAGAKKHSLASRWRLARVRARGFDGPKARYFGADIADLIEQMKRYYGALWESLDPDAIPVRGRPPRIVLELPRD